MEKYSFHDIERKWRTFWTDHKVFECDLAKVENKFYCLSMYPYPSGVLHMGHVINYTLSDVIVRFKKMQGYNVLSPMGWDSFGLPAENAAIKNEVHPKKFTEDNIRRMRDQMRRAGWGYDWRRELATSHPGYYQWTQWLFLEFYKKGLAYKKKAPVNWCPSCLTVLANEQVIDGRCERCNADVIQKDLEQWFFRMSKYAERLLRDLERLKGYWPDKVLKMQTEWIGRSVGTEIEFPVEGMDEKIRVFTTRPDTLFGVTFVSLAAEHPLVERLVRANPKGHDIAQFIQNMKKSRLSEKDRALIEKEGVFLNHYVTNPLNGERVQIWVANYALMEYGTGAVMAVPAHDQRDFEFAKKYDLPIKVVIQPKGETLDPNTMSEAYEYDGIQVSSGLFDGMENQCAKKAITEHLEKNAWGSGKIQYRLRDWLLSRQRYWGAAIPIIYCEKCGEVPVPEEDLPVRLPENVTFVKEGGNPLARTDEFIHAKCPRCHQDARRETDTMDTFVDSSWYFLRFLSNREDKKVFDQKTVNAWLPIDLYIGGIEHATMHLIYFRFFTKVLHDLGLIGFDEPAKRLFCQGMVCKTAYYSEEDKWLTQDEVTKKVKDGKTVLISKKSGSCVSSEIAKMSKTKLNTVNPDEIFDRFGADTVRLYMLSDAPPDRDQIWSEEGVMGAHRFIQRFWRLFEEQGARFQRGESYDGDGSDLDKSSRHLWRKTHETIQKFTSDVEGNFQFNTAISKVMELLKELRNHLEANAGVVRETFQTMILLLAPIIPHVSEELWQKFGNKESVFKAHWPEVRECALEKDEVEIVFQINGKLKNKKTVPVDLDVKALKQLVLGDEKMKSALEGKQVLKVICVKNKLANVVAK